LKWAAFLSVVLLAATALVVSNANELFPMKPAPALTGSFAYPYRDADGVRLSFGPISQNNRIDSFNFMIEEMTGGISSINSTWRVETIQFGTSLILNTNSSQMPQIVGVTYFDNNQDGSVSLGDSLLVSIESSVLNSEHHFRATMVQADSGASICSVQFDTPLAVAAAQLDVNSVEVDGNTASLVFDQPSRNVVWSELEIHIQQIAPVIGTETMWNNWIDSQGLHLTNRHDSPDPTPEIVSMTYVDLYSNGAIDMGDGIQIVFFGDLSDHVYHLRIERGLDGAFMGAADIGLGIGDPGPIVIPRIGSFESYGVDGSTVELVFGNFTELHRLTEFRFYVDDISNGRLALSGRWTASAYANDTPLQLEAGVVNPTPQIVAINYLDVNANGMVDSGDRLSFSMSEQTLVPYQYKVTMYLTAPMLLVATTSFYY
jgi:hypothetical protein